MLNDHRGFALVNASILSLVLAGAGAWYLYRSYTSGDLKADIAAMVDDGAKLREKGLSMKRLVAVPPEGSVRQVKEILLPALRFPDFQKATVPSSIPSTAIEQGAYYDK